RIHARTDVCALWHLDGIQRAFGRIDAKRREQVPLVLDRVAWPQLARPRDGVRVHPASSRNGVADTQRRTRQPRQPRASRPAVEVDHQIESPAPEIRADAPIVADSTGPVVSGMTRTSSRWGLPWTTGAAASSTR